MHRKLIVVMEAILLALLAGSVIVSAGPSSPSERTTRSPGPGNTGNVLALAPAAIPVGSGFTYQGQLKDGANPANGQYDLAFSLYDALTGGNLVSSPITLTNQTVTNGLFTVQLDFGAGAFQGDGRWLEIAVRQTGGGSYTTLSPRQSITPAPYALFALKSKGYANVVVVAKSGGDFTSIQAALNSITDNSATNHYLVRVAPGTYTETVTMKQWVDIEGAGEEATKITFTGSAGVTGTVVGASNAELRFLTVENTGGNTYAMAIYNNSASPSLLHVTATASGGPVNDGVYNISSSPNMTSVTATASGGSANVGVYNTSSSSPNMTNVTATASGGSGSYNYGVYNNFTSSPKIVTSIMSASGGISNYGVYDSGSSTVTIDSSKITGTTNTIYNGSGVTTRVGASQLAGGSVSNSGTLTCAGVYDENYVFFPSTCP